LRGADADGDQEFCRTYAGKHELPFHTIDFNTGQVAQENKISIQEAARNLRYEWLERIRKEVGYHFIVTAHHKNDNAETVLLNLVKNTGLRGLHGILPKRHKIVRPFLSVTRKEIEQYAAEHSIDYREDISNESTKYTRNFIRHEVLPKIEEINHDAVEAIHALTERIRDTECLVDERIGQIKKRIIVMHGNVVELKYGFIQQHDGGKTILFELLREYGFNGDQVASVYQGFDAQPGIEFHSPTHRIIKDRRSLFITPLESDREHIRKWDSLPDQMIFNNYKIQVRAVPAEKCTIKRSADYAYFDLDKIAFPLTLRYRRDGDYFYPYGLTKPNSDKVGKKKLSKYFKDQKFPAHLKDSTPVLFAGDQLIWLVGQRIDDRVKVGKDTKSVLKLKIVSS